MSKFKPYTAEQIEWLRVNYPRMDRYSMAEAFNKDFNDDRTVEALVAACKNRKIRSGRDSRFKKGHRTWNTGTKGLVKPNSGCFQKGNQPQNHTPVGHERIDSQHGYIWKKVAEPNKFRLKHQLVWEKHNGVIPKGMVLWFIDGNRQNCVIENLELIKKTEQIRRNKLRLNQQPKEIQDTLKLVAKTQVAISERRQKLEC